MKSKDVASWITKDHQQWLDMPRAEGKTVVDGAMRKYKIDLLQSELNLIKETDNQEF